MEDIRWKQRFSNYQKALQRLKDNIEYFSTFLAENTTPADILKQGISLECDERLRCLSR